jgi:hypothetical protein
MSEDISSEASERTSADDSLVTKMSQDISSEASDRLSADTSLESKIEALSSGIGWHENVDYAFASFTAVKVGTDVDKYTLTNITQASSPTYVLNQRVLLKGDNEEANGIFTITTVSSQSELVVTRVPEMNDEHSKKHDGSYKGAAVYVKSGDYTNDAFVCIEDAQPDFGTAGDHQEWTQFAGTDAFNHASGHFTTQEDNTGELRIKDVKVSANGDEFKLIDEANGTINTLNFTSTSELATENFSISGNDIKFSKDPVFGTVQCNSDEKLKKNIAIIDGKDALKSLNAIRGVDWEWKSTSEKSSGIIAQDLMKIPALKHLVNENQNLGFSVNYNGLHGFLISSIQELSKQISQLKQ